MEKVVSVSTFTYLHIFARGALGVLFALSSIRKLRDIESFERGIQGFEIVPDNFIWLVARGFIIGEVAVALIMGVGLELLRPAFLTASILLATFSLALISVLIRGIRTSCNCFGSTERKVTKYDLVRNVIFLTITIVGFPSARLLSYQPSMLSMPEYIFVTLAAVAFVLISISYGEMAVGHQAQRIDIGL